MVMSRRAMAYQWHYALKTVTALLKGHDTKPNMLTRRVRAKIRNIDTGTEQDLDFTWNPADTQGTKTGTGLRFKYTASFVSIQYSKRCKEPAQESAALPRWLRAKGKSGVHYLGRWFTSNIVHAFSKDSVIRSHQSTYTPLMTGQMFQQWLKLHTRPQGTSNNYN